MVTAFIINQNKKRVIMDVSTKRLKLMVYSSMMATLMAVGAYIAIPVGPVPIVLQNLFVMLAALLLGGRWGFISVCVYLLAGAVGLPVFAGGTGGLGKFVGPTGGYLIGFAIAAYLIGTISERGQGMVVVDILAMLVGTIVVYAVGVSWLKVITGMTFSKAIAVGVLPFLLGDVLKIAAAIPIVKSLRPMIAERILVLRTVS
jgi:biotin transport system substrate-specific component